METAVVNWGYIRVILGIYWGYIYIWAYIYMYIGDIYIYMYCGPYWANGKESGSWARGVLHRDLKPENVLLLTARSDSPVKVIDFGLCLVCTKMKSLSLWGFRV